MSQAEEDEDRLCKGLISILVDFPGTVQSIYIASSGFNRNELL